MSTDFKEIRQARLERHGAVSIAHQAPVRERCRHPMIAKKRMPSVDEMRERARGMDLSKLGEFLRISGFWEAVGPQMEELEPELAGTDWKSLVLDFDHPNLNFLFGVLNGNVAINYERAFPNLAGAEGLLNNLKKRKYYANCDVDDGSPENNIAAPADVIYLNFLERLNRNLDDADRERVAELSLLVLDYREDVCARVAAYRETKEIYARYSLGLPDIALVEAFENMAAALKLSADSPVALARENSNFDVIVVLYNWDAEILCYRAGLLFQRNPEAKVALPGGQTPHEVQELGDVLAATERQEMMAYLLSGGHETLLKDNEGRGLVDREPTIFPDSGLREDDLLLIDKDSCNTVSNVESMRGPLERLREELGRALRMVLVVGDGYGQRAATEFAKQLPPKTLESLWVQENGVAMLTNMAAERKANAVVYFVAEWVKNLYDILTMTEEQAARVNRLLGQPESP